MDSQAYQYDSGIDLHKITIKNVSETINQPTLTETTLPSTTPANSPSYVPTPPHQDEYWVFDNGICG